MLPSRFASKVNFDGPKGCWLWIASRDRKGYGQYHQNGATCRSHRVAYELLVGPIPEGLQIDHLCRVPACVNPDHMEPVTSKVNTQRGIAGSLRAVFVTHCRSGHPLAEPNLYVNPRGERQCRRCTNAASARYLRRQREAIAATGGNQ